MYKQRYFQSFTWISFTDIKYMIYIWVFPEQLNTYNTKQTNKLMNFGSKTAVAIAYFLVLNFEGHFLISWSLSHKNLYMASWILTLSDILYSHTHTHTHTSMLICYTWVFLYSRSWDTPKTAATAPPPMRVPFTTFLKAIVDTIRLGKKQRLDNSERQVFRQKPQPTGERWWAGLNL